VTDIRLLSFIEDGASRAGILVDDRVFTPAELTGALSGAPAHSVRDILDRWQTAWPALAEAASSAPDGGRALGQVRLAAPVPRPGTIYCAGANYRDHQREMGGEVYKPKDPWFFVKSANAVIGPDENIRLPAFSTKVDWEAEIALVIGRAARNVPAERALDYLAGYTILNDLSARDFIKREDSHFIFDWVGQKCFDTAAPMGPWITPREAIADPDDMSIELRVNDVIKQDSNSRELIHNFVEQIAYLSSRITLQPGDVIATGTPSGVGMGRGEFLKPGDEVRIAIGGCGELVNRCVAGE
jgi:2-keto-4-pentenoate hydratase/2-oxohepta-3-ene-1,7-dioic acid hydratase in catechol pathway